MDACDFKPSVATCEKHGDYAENVLQGADVRWYAGCPKCAAEAATNALLGRMAIPKRFTDRTLDNYQTSNDGQRNALSIAKAYAADFENAAECGRSMLFCGNPGTGKTHLAIGIAHAIAQRGYTALYAKVYEAILRIKETWGNREEKESEVVRSFQNPDLLILDEVGRQFGSDTEKNLLFSILDARYLAEKPTILMSNLNRAGVEESLGGAAYDRLKENGGRIVVFDWQSNRGAA